MDRYYARTTVKSSEKGPELIQLYANLSMIMIRNKR